MMGISYVVSVYKIENLTELFTIYFITNQQALFLQQIFAPGYLFLHHFRAQLVVLRAQICAFTPVISRLA